MTFDSCGHGYNVGMSRVDDGKAAASKRARFVKAKSVSFHGALHDVAALSGKESS